MTKMGESKNFSWTFSIRECPRYSSGCSHRPGNVMVMGSIPVDARIFSVYSGNCWSCFITAMIILLTILPLLSLADVPARVATDDGTRLLCACSHGGWRYGHAVLSSLAPPVLQARILRRGSAEDVGGVLVAPPDWLFPHISVRGDGRRVWWGSMYELLLLTFRCSSCFSLSTRSIFSFPLYSAATLVIYSCCFHSHFLCHELDRVYSRSLPLMLGRVSVLVYLPFIFFSSVPSLDTHPPTHSPLWRDLRVHFSFIPILDQYRTISNIGPL